jgi:signal transduction histidine kinase
MTKLIRLMYGTFVLSIVTFAILSFTYFQRLKRLDQNIKSVEQANVLLLSLEELNGQLYGNVSQLRDMFWLNEKSKWPDILISNLSILRNVDSLAHLIDDDPTQQARILRMKSILETRAALVKDSVTYIYDSNDSATNTRLIHRLQDMLVSYQRVYADFRNTEHLKRDARQEMRHRFEKFSVPLLTVLLSFAGLLIISTFFYMMVTLRRRIFLQYELQAKIETLNLANKELENLSRVTSHHIQEPMRKISNFSSLLDMRLEETSREEVREIIRKIEGNASGLQLLAQNLVQYSHLIQEQKPKEPVNLNHLIDEILHRLDDLIFAHKAEIKRSSLPSIPAIPGQLFVVFQELIKNAIQFTKPQESPMIEIFQLPARRPKTVLVAVKDFGIGFSNEYAERIFRIFEQLEPRSAPGKGIGLAMCSRVMLNHGGRIWASGEPGHHAVFYLEFPTH